MVVHIPGLLGPIPSSFGAFHYQTSYILNQITICNQFAYNIPPKPPFFLTLFTILPNPLTLTQTNPKKTQQMEKVKHNLVMRALEQRLRLSQMVIAKSSIAICCELQVFYLTTNQFNVFCSIRFLPSDGVVSKISLIFQSKFDGVWPTWCKVPKLVQHLWFREFEVNKATTY